jgi:hypothetical protein
MPKIVNCSILYIIGKALQVIRTTGKHNFEFYGWSQDEDDEEEGDEDEEW